MLNSTILIVKKLLVTDNNNIVAWRSTETMKAAELGRYHCVGSVWTVESSLADCSVRAKFQLVHSLATSVAFFSCRPDFSGWGLDILFVASTKNVLR